MNERKRFLFLAAALCLMTTAAVRHWHGAAADSWFSHLSIEAPGETPSNQWLEPVTDEDYAKLR